MTDQRLELEWGQTAHLLAMLHNTRIGADTRPKSPDDCNPLRLAEQKLAAEVEAEARPKGPRKGGLGVLKDVFIDGKLPTTP